VATACRLLRPAAVADLALLNDADADRYAELAKPRHRCVADGYWRDGRLTVESQANYVRGLRLGLIPDADRATALLASWTSSPRRVPPRHRVPDHALAPAGAGRRLPTSPTGCCCSAGWLSCWTAVPPPSGRTGREWTPRQRRLAVALPRAVIDSPRVRGQSAPAPGWRQFRSHRAGDGVTWAAACWSRSAAGSRLVALGATHGGRGHGSGRCWRPSAGAPRSRWVGNPPPDDPGLTVRGPPVGRPRPGRRRGRHRVPGPRSAAGDGCSSRVTVDPPPEWPVSRRPAG
jgi:hypothetical protein